MKYIEELLIGDCYQYNGCQYVVTTDYKQNGTRLCVSLVDGSTKWMLPDLIIDPIDIFTVDKDSNIVAIKERKKDVSDQTKNFH